MARPIRMIIASIILLATVVNLTGCAIGWFLAGAGTAATVAAVAIEQDRGKPDTGSD